MIKESKKIFVSILIIYFIIIGIMIFIDNNKIFISEKNNEKVTYTIPYSEQLNHNKKFIEYLPENSLHPVTDNSFNGYYEGPNGKEFYYNIDAYGIIKLARSKGYDEESYPYWVREDGCRMFGKYIICAVDYNKHSYGSIINTSLGKAICLDTGGLLIDGTRDVDILTDWY